MRRNVWNVVMLSLSLFVASSLMPQTSELIDPAEASGEWVDIATREDLNKIKDDTYGHYRLINNIDMGDTDWGTGIVFKGHFDGQGYKIENLKTVNRRGMSGLFISIEDGGLVENLVLEVEIVDAGAAAGGLASQLFEGTISNVYVTGTISNDSSTTGGIVGTNNKGEIINSVSKVHIQGADVSGGIAGLNYNGTILNSYAMGSVNGEDTVGGLVGRNEVFSTITNSYAAGEVTGRIEVGGLAGENSATISNSYWDTEATGQADSGGGTGLTSEEMKLVSSFTGWDFDTVWTIDPGESYPELQGYERFPGLARPVRTIEDIASMHGKKAAYELMNDIDFGGYTGNWTPINFYGYFDGNGHTIRNLNISDNSTNMGLFGTNTGVIKNLVMADFEIKGGAINSGGLVGSNRGGTIDNVAVTTGTVEGDSAVGGLAGTNSGTIRNSYADVTVHASMDSAGGLVGSVNVLDGNKGEVFNSYGAGDVSGQSKVGGLVGSVEDGTEIINSYAIGKVEGTDNIGGLIGLVEIGGQLKHSYARGAVSGVYDVGGLVGSNDGTILYAYVSGHVVEGQQERVGGLVGRSGSSGQVEEAYALADVTGRYDVGGLIGLNEGIVRNAYVIGDVYANGVDASRVFAGGLIGRNLDNGTVEYTFAAGTVSGHQDRPDIVGGLLGGNTNADANAVIHSYWDTETSELSSSAGGEGLTTEELVRCDTFMLWVDTIWEQDCDAHYPKLKSIEADDDRDFVALKPLVTPPSGLYNHVEVEIDGEEGAVIYYTLDGVDPDTSSQVYTEPFTISETTTLKVIQQDQAGNISSVAVVEYDIDKEAPTAVELFPANESQGIATNTHLEIRFSEAIFLGTGSIVIKQAADHQLVESIDITGAHVIQSDSNTLTIKPSSELLENTAYYILIDNTTFRDEAGNLYNGISDEATWQFQTEDAHAPFIQSVSVPAAGAYKEGDTLFFTVAFQEDVIVDTSSGKPRLELKVGSSSAYAVYESGSGSGQLQFSYTTAPDQEDTDGITIEALDLNNGKIRDLYGNHANVTLHGVEETSGIVIDAIRPIITLLGSPSVTIEKGHAFIDAGAAAMDNRDGALTASIKVINPVDENVVGTYTVIYEVTDNAGNSSDPVTREVKVIPNAVEVEGSIGIPQTIDVRGAETGALLSLFSADDVTISSGTANPQGQYRFEGVPYGSGYTVSQEVYGLQSPPSASVSVLKSGNANLNGLSISEGTLTPPFSATTDAYEVELPHHVQEVTVTASVYDATAGIAIDGHSASERTISLQVGDNPIPIVVTAQDGTTQIYELLVIRSEAPQADGSFDHDEEQDRDIEPNIREKRTAVVFGVGNQSLVNITIERETVNGIKQDRVNILLDDIARAIELLKEQDQSTMTIEIPTLEGDPADETTISFSSAAAQELALHEISIKLRLSDVALSIEADALANRSDDHSSGMTWTFAKVTDSEDLRRSDAILDELSNNSRRVGPSIDIEHGSSISTKVSLPLEYLKLPEDSEALRAYLSRLRVLVEHSDGENEIHPGMIEYDEEQIPAFISVYVERFSTFTLIEDPLVNEALTDIQGHWAEEAILELIRREAISGFPDLTFRPDQPMTRAEFTTVLIKAFDIEARTADPAVFTDIRGHWAEKEIQVAYRRGIVLGYENSTFRPDESITREHMAAMLVRAMDVSPSQHKLHFTDSNAIADWALESVKTALHLGVITGYPDNSFKPKQTATRAEAITMIINGLQLNNS